MTFIRVLIASVLLAGTAPVSGQENPAASPKTGSVAGTVIDEKSGEGISKALITLRRDPDIRWRRGERDLAAFAATELKMLQRAAEVVAPGGRLLYATCSSEPEENEGVVDAFLASTSQFVPVHAQAAAPHLPVHVIDSRGHLRTEPHRHGLEAFFGAVFERRNPA